MTRDTMSASKLLMKIKEASHNQSILVRNHQQCMSIPPKGDFWVPVVPSSRPNFGVMDMQFSGLQARVKQIYGPSVIFNGKLDGDTAKRIVLKSLIYQPTNVSDTEWMQDGP